MSNITELRDRCAIVGVGETTYTRGTDKSSVRLHLEAALNAIQDAGLSPKDIDGYFAYPHGGVLAEHIILNLGISDLKHSATIHMGGAMAVSSIQHAVLAITSGVCNYVLVTAGRRGYSEQRVSTMAERAGLTTPPLFSIINEFEAPYGVFGVTGFFAASMRRHMYEYGTTSRQFGAIAVACRKHAMLNSKAVMRKPITLEDHQNSRMIIDPLHLLDCSLETDGAGAVVVTSAERARGLKHVPVYITGVAEGHPDRPFSETTKVVMTELPGVRKAAIRAFAMAGLTAGDVDLAEIYDAFTWICLTGIEDIGFCQKGEGGPFVEGGRIELGGKLPINTHGGLLSEAHVSGINHIVEGVRQLRGECGERQVRGAEVALVSGVGDFGDGGVMLLRR